MPFIFRSLRFCLLVGIGNGVLSGSGSSSVNDSRGDGNNGDANTPTGSIYLGDIVVGWPEGLLGSVVQFDAGKVRSRSRFEPTGSLNAPLPVTLVSAVGNLQSDAKPHQPLSATLAEAVDKQSHMRKYFARPATELDRLHTAEYEHEHNSARGTCNRCRMRPVGSATAAADATRRR
jgi:hypothetical protein